MPLLIINGSIVSEESGGAWGTPTPLTIASGVISVTGSGFYEIDTQAGVGSDALDTINGGGAGDVIVLKSAADARNVVITDGTTGADNLDLLGLDITLDTANQRVKLQKDSSGNWVEYSSRP